MVDYILKDLQIGTLTSGISSGSTTLASASFAAIPVISAPAFMWMSLDPDGVDGTVEIVKITAHSSSSTSITVTRGHGGTTPRSHAADTKVVAGLVKAVFDEIEDELTVLRADVDTVFPSYGQGVMLGKSATQSITGGNTAFITWTSEAYDPDGWHATDSSLITLPFTGFYMVKLAIDLDSGGVDSYRFRRNSATPGAGGSASILNVPSVEFSQGTSNLYLFTTGDEFRVEAWDTNDGTATVIGVGSTLHIVYLGG